MTFPISDCGSYKAWSMTLQVKLRSRGVSKIEKNIMTFGICGSVSQKKKVNDLEVKVTSRSHQCYAKVMIR